MFLLLGKNILKQSMFYPECLSRALQPAWSQTVRYTRMRLTGQGAGPWCRTTVPKAPGPGSCPGVCHPWAVLAEGAVAEEAEHLDNIYFSKSHICLWQKIEEIQENA